MHDYVVVGSGLFGCVIAERIANVLGKTVLLIEKRDHIGGNCYSETDTETGIEFHKYGTHIFHTSSQKDWGYINQFTAFNSYTHQVLTVHQGKAYQMPINLETINSFYNVNLAPFEVDAFLAKEFEKETFANPQNLEEQAITLVGRPLYEAFIKGYTIKQWQKDPRELPAAIMHRLPIRKNYDETYFNNALWQGIPRNGYTAAFAKMVKSPKIEVRTSTDYFLNRDAFNFKEKLIYTGPIDRFFDFRCGTLEWRSIELKREVKPYADFQGTSVMNYADIEIPWTRIHEPRHLHPERKYRADKTVIFYEYSKVDAELPCYPIGNSRNMDIFRKYRDLANQQKNLVVGGRLGRYAYYDMDQAIDAALTCFDREIAGKTN